MKRKILSSLLTLIMVLSVFIGNAAMATGSDLIRAIEVNQGLSYQRDMNDGSLRFMENFVAGKDTAIILELSRQVNVDTEGNDQYVTILRDGEEITTLTPRRTTSRTNRLEFLPTSRDQVDFWKEGIYDIIAVIDGEEATRRVEFRQTRNLEVLAVPVKANYGGDVRTVEGDWRQGYTFTNRVYPIANSGINWVIGRELDASASKYDLTTDEGMFNLWQSLTNLQTRDSRGNPRYDLIVGFVLDRQGDGGIMGYTYGMPTSIVTESDEDMLATVAHEIAHCFDIGDEYDYGSVNPAINPPPYGMKGYDWNTQELVKGDNPYFKIDRNRFGTGVLIEKELRPYEYGGRGHLPDMTSFMGGGGPPQEAFWITSPIWNHLYGEFAQDGTVDKEPEQAPDPQESIDEDDYYDDEHEPYDEDDYYDDYYDDDSEQQDLVSPDDWLEDIDNWYYDEAYDDWFYDNEGTPFYYDEDDREWLYYEDGYWYYYEPDSGATFRRGEVELIRVIEAYGTIDRENNVTVSPWYSWDMEEDAYEDETGEYSIEAVDEKGEVLTEQGFDISFRTMTHDAVFDKAPFYALMKFPEGVDSFNIKKGDEVLKTLEVSPNTPTAEFIFPQGGEDLDGKAKIQWEGYDEDGDEVFYELWYSEDGEYWDILAADITETSLEVDFSELAGGKEARLSLFATDGINTVEIDSEFFSVPVKAPEIEILQPKDLGDTLTFYEGEEFRIDTEVYDLQDGWLYDDDLLWTDSWGTELYYGESIYYDFTPSGEYELTLTATNSHGLTDSITIELIVLHPDTGEVVEHIPSDWAIDDVYRAEDYLIVPGSVMNYYQNNITREEFAELAVTMYEAIIGEELEIVEDNPFEDTDNDYILIAYDLGIVKGISDSNFAPNNTITRQEMAVMFYRTLGLILDEEEMETDHNITAKDSDQIAEWALEALTYMNDIEIIRGIGDGIIAPLDNASKEVSIIMALRIYEKIMDL